jgi:NADH:ubiquinone oxidoreductase subunit E
MTKLPTRSPTHEDVPPSRLAAMGLELEDIADGDEVALPALIELAEDRGRPASHYLAALPLATELRLAAEGDVTVRVCAGNCQRWGALDLLDHLAERAAKGTAFAIAPVSCLDRCDLAPACEIHGAHGQLVLAPATRGALDEALRELTR